MAKAIFQGIVARVLPSAFVDDRDSAKTVRLKRYGEVNISEADGSLYGYCDEGSLMVATNATISTGLTGVTAQTAFNDTGPALYIYNNHSTLSLYMGYLKMVTTAAATSTTIQSFACILDPARSTTITTNNFATLTPVNPNGSLAVSFAPVILFQNNATVSQIAASSSSKRIVARGNLGGLNVAGDEFIINFGRGDHTTHAGLTAAQSAALSKRVANAPPVVIGPGHTFTVHCWGTSQAAAYSPEVELVMWAR
jgi:hypothetical protein